MLEFQELSTERTASTKSARLWSVELVVIAALVIAPVMILRCCNLDGKVVWRDEVLTALYLSGHSENDVLNTLKFGCPIGVRELSKYQEFTHTGTPIRTVQNLAAWEPEHAPAYYVLAKLWSNFAGPSFTSIRCFSALASLLAVPFAWWLAFELFRDTRPALLFACLVAASPLHVVYAQEGREYSIWLVTILWSSASLLHAIRRSDKLAWLHYSVALCACMYTHVLGLIVALSHFVFMLLRAGSTKQRIYFFCALALALVAFSPWLWLLGAGVHGISDRLCWTRTVTSLPRMVSCWLGACSGIFFDFDYSRFFGRTNPALCLQSVVATLFACFEVYAAAALLRSKKSDARLFICLLGAINFLALAAPDVFLGGARSTAVRYLIPSIVAIQLACAYILFEKLRITTSFRILTVALVVCAELCSCRAVFADDWWNKSDDSLRMRQVAACINKYTEPVVLVPVDSYNVADVLGLCRLLRSDTVIVPASRNMQLNSSLNYSFVVIPRGPEGDERKFTCYDPSDFEQVIPGVLLRRIVAMQ